MPPPKKRSAHEDNSDSEKPKKRSTWAHGTPGAPKTKSAHVRYTDTHRRLLQTFMFRKVMTEEDLDQVLKDILKETKEHVPVSDAIASINAMLNDDQGAFHLQIKSRQAVEENQGRVFGLVNTRSDAISKQSTPFEDWHLAMFKVTLRLIATSETGYTSHTDVIHAFKDENKKGSDIATVLNNLVVHQWLAEHPTETNFFTVGQRTMLELSDTMRDLGAIECPVSKMTVVRTPKYQTWLKTRQALTPSSTTTTTSSA